MKNISLTILVIVLSIFLTHAQNNNIFIKEDINTDFHTKEDIEIEKLIFYKDPVSVKEYELDNESQEFDWVMPLKLYIKPSLITTENVNDNFSDEFLLEEMSLGIEDYITESDFIAKAFSRNKYLYIHAEIDFTLKSDTQNYKLAIIEVYSIPIVNNDYSIYYSGNKYSDIGFIIPMILIFQDNSFKIIPSSKAREIFPDLSDLQFSHSNNFQKLLDSVPSYIESTKNDDNTRTEKVITN